MQQGLSYRIVVPAEDFRQEEFSLSYRERTFVQMEDFGAEKDFGAEGSRAEKASLSYRESCYRELFVHKLSW